MKLFGLAEVAGRLGKRATLLTAWFGLGMTGCMGTRGNSRILKHRVKYASRFTDSDYVDESKVILEHLGHGIIVNVLARKSMG